MAGVDAVLVGKETRAAERQARASAQLKRLKDSTDGSATAILISSSSSSETETEGDGRRISEDDEYGAVGGCSPIHRKKRGRKTVVTPELAAALDRTKVSDRKALFVVAETAKSLGHDVASLALNRSSLRRQRLEYRSEVSTRLKAEFQSGIPLVIHWDGKLIQDLTSKEKVDRLPILVSGKGISQLLSVAKLPSGTGEAQAAAVHSAIEDWKIAGQIRAMCFDTTSSNTGRIAGACTLLEQKLDKELLPLACRHHIAELIIGSTFQVCMGATSAPQVLLFKRFQQQWEYLDREKYQTGVDCPDVASYLLDIKDSILQFAMQHLAESQPRDDYREFLELTVIFLGGAPSRGVRFLAPGPMHHARWMSKVLYSLKVWMLRSQFSLTAREERGLRDICIFAVRIYLKAWIRAPLATCAPFNDLQLMKSLLEYSSINTAISKVTSEKLSKHMWYLSEHLVCLAFFDSAVSTQTKQNMVAALNMEELNVPDSKVLPVEKRVIITSLESFHEKKLEDFVTKNSIAFFHKIDISTSFLQSDPSTWEERDDYKMALETVKCMAVVNDHAERGVALIQEYSGLFTHDESQLQFLLQVVADHRRAFPDSKKETLLSHMP